MRDKFKLTWREGKGPGQSKTVDNPRAVIENAYNFLSSDKWTSLSIRKLSRRSQKLGDKTQ